MAKFSPCVSDLVALHRGRHYAKWLHYSRGVLKDLLDVYILRVILRNIKINQLWNIFKFALSIMFHGTQLLCSGNWFAMNIVYGLSCLLHSVIMLSICDSVTGFSTKDFFWRNKFGTWGGPKSVIFGAMVHDPLYFEVGIYVFYLFFCLWVSCQFWYMLSYWCQ